MKKPRSGTPIAKQNDQHSETEHSDTARVRMTVDLVGTLAEELEKAALQSGKTKSELMREGLGYVLRAIKARDEGYYVGAWKEEPDGKIIRSREFVISS